MREIFAYHFVALLVVSKRVVVCGGVWWGRGYVGATGCSFVLCESKRSSCCCCCCFDVRVCYAFYFLLFFNVKCH